MRFMLGALYVGFTICMACLIPILTIPVFQNLGLSGRDVTGFSLVITFISTVLLIGFGALVWTEKSHESNSPN